MGRKKKLRLIKSVAAGIGGAMAFGLAIFYIVLFIKAISILVGDVWMPLAFFVLMSTILSIEYYQGHPNG